MPLIIPETTLYPGYSEPWWQNPYQVTTEPTVALRPQYHKTTYLNWAIDADRRKDTVGIALERLKPLQTRFDAIAVTGMSGVTIGSVLAHELHKHLLLVRKSNAIEKSHASDSVEGPLDWTPRARYLIC